MEKVLYVTPQALQLDSFRLGMKVVQSGFRPDLMIALWRGGAPIGLYVHEALRLHGIQTDHIAIRTSRYTAPGKANAEIVVHNLGYVREQIDAHDHTERPYNILIVDDVWESGGSIKAVLDRLREEIAKGPDQKRALDIRFATLFFKPACNKTPYIPNFYVRTVDEHVWINFPHELEGLDDIRKVMGDEVANALFLK
jgi:hypoxanthine phosphoribosyltransferase